MLILVYPHPTYIQFFIEANDTNKKLQRQHETIRKKFACDKTTPLVNLQELLRGLEVKRAPVYRHTHTPHLRFYKGQLLRCQILWCLCHQKEQEYLNEHKQQVQQLVNKSKTIVRLRPRNPEEKSTEPVKVQALCDFRQEQVTPANTRSSPTHPYIWTGKPCVLYSSTHFLLLFVRSFWAESDL